MFISKHRERLTLNPSTPAIKICFLNGDFRNRVLLACNQLTTMYTAMMFSGQFTYKQTKIDDAIFNLS